MELPNKMLAERAAKARLCYALSVSKLERKRLLKNDGLRLELDEDACELAHNSVYTNEQLAERAYFYARTGEVYLCCVHVKAWIKRRLSVLRNRG